MSMQSEERAERTELEPSHDELLEGGVVGVAAVVLFMLRGSTRVGRGVGGRGGGSEIEEETR